MSLTIPALPSVAQVFVNGGVVLNQASARVYYRDEPFQTTSGSDADGSLAIGESATLGGAQWLATARGAGSGVVTVNPPASASGGSGVILPWATATAYVLGQPVTYSGSTYTAIDAHTAGATFVGDQSAHWRLLPVAANDRTGIWLPKDWGSIWLPKMRAAATNGATIALVGDSISQGLDASTYALSWPGRVAATLQALYGDGGTGFYTSARSVTYNALWAPFSWKIGQTGTWTTSQTDKNGPGAMRLSSTVNGSTLTFTTRGSRVRVYHLTGASFQGYTVTIDGGAASATQATAGAASVGFSEFTGLSTGTHTVVVTAVTNGTNAVSICGIKGYNATGVVLDNYSVLGYYSDTFNGAAAAFSAPAGIWSGGTSNPADLVIYALGVNDVITPQNTSEATYLANVRLYLDTIDLSTTDLLFLMPHIGKWETRAGSVKTYHLYASRMRTLAEIYGAGYINLWAMYRNSWSVFNALSGWAAVGHDGTGAAGIDDVHQGDTGHGLYADIIAPVVQGIA